ncbi:MAG: hypothetical protein K2Y51_04740, partial [Gammaproteobacteria bacterium]|nr:hypothetical protein [Gammaproteobacteria bacterium]
MPEAPSVDAQAEAWRAMLEGLEAGLADCLARDAAELGRRLAGLRRSLAGRGRRLRPGQVTRVLGVAGADIIQLVVLERGEG